ncbi:PKD domain-containing protein [Kitasatospora sp. McL0602]|uniref:PKD domain-containing protein n=1 Tax=Kitasatospora sp. McL0602 TaxID=3439530 RepID=UPI003F8BFDCC
MRLRNLAGLASATSVVLGVGLPIPSHAVADSSTIYVDNSTAAHCADTGASAGTQQQPYCTVQAAADAAQPGQTVKVAPGQYDEQVTLTHSGSEGKPITFLGGVLRTLPRPVIGLGINGTGQKDRGFVLNGVHDVRISGFTVVGNQEAFLLTDAARVSVDGNYAWGGYGTAVAPATVHLTGSTTATTVARNILFGGKSSIVVDAGVSGAVVSGNAIDNRSGGGVQITDAPGTVVTGNTASTLCAPAVALLGDSSKAVVENNILATSQELLYSYVKCDHAADGVKLLVSTPSAVGSVAKYNLLNPLSGQPSYSWADKTYATSADFTTAVPGQGAHDLTADPVFEYTTGLTLRSGSPAVDSADASAPGESATDILGLHRIQVPHVTNGEPGYYDRGAYEVTTSNDPPKLTVSQYSVPVGTALTFTPAWSGWSPVVSYSYDFGDGTAPLVTTDRSAQQHAYATPGSYKITVTATLQNGDTTEPGTGWAKANPAGDLIPAMSVSPGNGPLTYQVSDTGTTTSWAVASRSYDFGDGSGPQGSDTHQYSHQGDYTVTMKVTDTGGRTASTSQVAHVAYQPGAFHAETPTRLLDTRQHTGGRTTLGPGESLTVSVPGGICGNPTAVVLNVTAVNKTNGGYLTVYPAGADRPTTSNVNFTAGQVVPNLVTVPVGKDGQVAIFNHSGSTDVVVDMFGHYGTGVCTGDRFTAQAPVRLLDTRTAGQSPIRAGYASSVQIRGVHGVPADATAAVLNVTATRGTVGGYFSLYPEYMNPTGTSNLNFGPGQTVANQVVVPIGADGKVQLSNFAGSADAVVDLFGYYSPKGESLFRPTTPTRLVDTRDPGKGALGAGASLAVASGAPAGATGAVLNVTATAPTTAGYLTAWADGSAKPGTSNLNFTAGQTVPNHVTTPLGGNGKFDVYNFNGSTQVVADLFGYFVKG